MNALEPKFLRPHGDVLGGDRCSGREGLWRLFDPPLGSEWESVAGSEPGDTLLKFGRDECRRLVGRVAEA